MSSPTTTPLMQQYFAVKAEYPDALVLFQVGDFYELFFDDAITAAQVLNITLTKRGQHAGAPIPLCGVPVHTLDTYLAKLVKAGFRLAICEQLEPAQAGKMVPRGVTRVLTPGTLTESNLLDDKSASYLLSFFPQADQWGLLFGELLTAQLYATTLSQQLLKALEFELGRFFPAEVLLPDSKLGHKFVSYFKQQGYFTSLVTDSGQLTERFNQVERELVAREFIPAAGELTAVTNDRTQVITNSVSERPRSATDTTDFANWLHQQFDDRTQQQLHQQPVLQQATANFHRYLAQRQAGALSQFKSIKFYAPEDFLLLDQSTQLHLELFKNSYDQTRQHTLFAHLDQAATPMGSRLIAKWLARPLVSLTQIQQRQQAVQQLLAQTLLSYKLQQQLRNLGDVERIVGRIALRRASLADYLQLLSALTALPEIQLLLTQIQRVNSVGLLAQISANLGDFSALTNLLSNALNDDPQQNWLIKTGFNQELDQQRRLIMTASQQILALEQREQARLGISSLKIRFNQIYGYYLEVTKPNLSLVPPEYTRLQTLVNCERFLSPELQSLQVALNAAQNALGDLEQRLFTEVKLVVEVELTALRKLAQALAMLDALTAFATVAQTHNYVCPVFNQQRDMQITAGRHPMVAAKLGQSFIANDTNLTEQASLWVITGPNMGGKSTYLRQVALISIMAQCGSFVPATAANLALVDRIFTRIGAGDYLSQGKSTFLVEMEETALICQLATKNSLVILDEVGRGTSTTDGLAIAQAVIEYLYQQVQARCLFATHYHELTQLAAQYPGIVNYYAQSQQTANGLVLLHKMVPGVANSSFGIEIAKLAQLPTAIITRAQTILAGLEQSQLTVAAASEPVAQSHQNLELVTKSVTLVDPQGQSGLVAQTMPDILALKSPVRHSFLATAEGAPIPAAQLAFLAQLEQLDYEQLSPRQAFELLWRFKHPQL